MELGADGALTFDAGVLEAIDGWGVPTAAVAVIDGSGLVASRGPLDIALPWASVTKLVTAIAVLVAADRGVVTLDEPAGPPGSTVRHLLAHASGLAPDQATPLSAPARTRIYSNAGFDLLGDLVADRAGAPFADVVRDWVLDPLGMTGSSLRGPASRGLVGPCRDLAALGRELLAPSILPAGIVAAASTVAFPGLRGVLPGSASRTRATGGSASSSAGRRRPIGPGHGTRRPRSATSGRPGRSCGSTRSRASRSRASPTEPSDRGPPEAWPALSDAVLAAYSGTQSGQ